MVCEAGVEVSCGIDPGYRHVCALLWAYLNHEDTMVVFDELAVAKTVISEVRKESKLRNQRWGVRPNRYVIDAAARNQKRPAVYNLEILDGSPEFFANGLLVHNCLDVLRYLVMARPLAPARDRPRHQESFKERALRAALKRSLCRRLLTQASGPESFLGRRLSNSRAEDGHRGGTAALLSSSLALDI